MISHNLRYTHIAVVLLLLASLIVVPSAEAQADDVHQTPQPGGTSLSAGDSQDSHTPVNVLESRGTIGSGETNLSNSFSDGANGEIQPGSVAASFYRHNLISNWNAENGTVGLNIPNWTLSTANPPKTAAYNTNFGTNPVPSFYDPGPTDRGQKFFISDPNACNVPTIAEQEISLTPITSAVLTGKVGFTVSGNFGGYGTRSGTASLHIKFIDGGNLHISPSDDVIIGGFTSADRLNHTGLLFDSADGLVPQYARKVRVELKFTGTGCYLGYADNLLFMVKEPSYPLFLPLLQSSNTVTPDRNPPAAPSDISATMKEYSGVNLWWRDNSNNETGFTIERMVQGVDSNYKTLGTVDANTTYYYDSSPINFQKTYTYRITAFNDAGVSSAATYNFKTPAPPGAPPAPPASCWVSNLTPTSAIFGWTDSSDNEEYFSLWIAQEGKNNNEYRFLANIEPDATYVHIIGLLPGVYSALSINAVNSFGQSADCYVEFTPPALTNTFQFNNKASYPINSLKIDGIEQLPTYPMHIPVGSYYEISLEPGVHEIEYTLGWWQDKDHRFNMYTFWIMFEVAPGTSSYDAFDPKITDLMTQFSDSGYWEGYYWDANITCHTAAFRFYKNGTYVFYVGNRQSGSGIYAYAPNPRDPNFFTVKFQVKDSGSATPIEGLMNELYGYYYMKNGPPGWNQIQYTYKPQGYMYNPFCP